MTEAPKRITTFYSGTFGEKGYWRPDPDDLAMSGDAIIPTRYVRADIADGWRRAWDSYKRGDIQLDKLTECLDAARAECREVR